MRKPSLVAVMVSVVFTAAGTVLFAQQEVSREYQEALLQGLVESGFVPAAQQKTILERWDTLRTKGHQSGLKLHGWKYVGGEGDHITSASVEFSRELTGEDRIDGELKLDNSGRNLQITFTRSPTLTDLTPASRKVIVEQFSASCLIDPSDKSEVLAELEAARGTSFTFTSKDACQPRPKTQLAQGRQRSSGRRSLVLVLGLVVVVIVVTLTFVLARRRSGGGVA